MTMDSEHDTHIDGLKKRLLKLTIIGARKSGKSALAVRFLTGKFIYEYATGKDLTYQYNFLLPASKVPLEITDTSQTENWSNELDDTDGVIIVYAIDNQKSFEKAEQLVTTIKGGDGKIPCTALVANKSDLWQYKSVETSVGKNLANKYMCSYFEMSALIDRDGVRDMFGNIVNLILERSKFNSRSYSLPNFRFNMKLNAENRSRSASVITPTMTKKDKKRLAKSAKANEKNSKLLTRSLAGKGLLSLTTLALPMPVCPED